MRKEYNAAKSLGLNVAWWDSLDTPFPNHGAVVLEDQAQFDPMDSPACPAQHQLREHGGTLHQGHRVTGVSLTGGRARFELDDGTTASAPTTSYWRPACRSWTGACTSPRSRYYERSYALAFEGCGCPGRACTSPPAPTSRSIRDAPVDGGTRVARRWRRALRWAVRARGLQHVDRLREWTAEHFPGAVETHQWSAQDYSPHDGVPFVGLLPRGLGTHLRRHRLRQVGVDQRGGRCPGDLGTDPG